MIKIGRKLTGGLIPETYSLLINNFELPEYSGCIYKDLEPEGPVGMMSDLEYNSLAFNLSFKDALSEIYSLNLHYQEDFTDLIKGIILEKTRQGDNEIFKLNFEIIFNEYDWKKPYSVYALSEAMNKRVNSDKNLGFKWIRLTKEHSTTREYRIVFDIYDGNETISEFLCANLPSIKGIFDEIIDDVTVSLLSENLKDNFNKVENKLKTITKTLIITEGKTDWKHLGSALDTFHEQDKFNELDIEFLRYNNEFNMSESELDSLLKQFSKIPSPKKIIGIFDRDAKIGKKYSEEEYKVLGNNVFGFSIPVPEHRTYHEGICIEFLYKDDDLQRVDSNGRKIFLSSEFDERTGRYKNNPLIGLRNADKINHKTEPKKVIIIDNDVFDEKGESLALSKNDFAENILNKNDKFINLDISGFEKVFEIISKIEAL
ncbi:hypothetical protein SOP93_17065 [Peribacillus frigoritolerans]|uniref:hypothetical protein n=1 Tax=Peribacillus frigoritolerans TaxID=450367 RepID=UPI002B254FA8|nr:hypothetical protein [Peribacillus frigoritolerans]MEB2492877.1 hypothetical protein [Peribacillus frigoritolerans]